MARARHVAFISLLAWFNSISAVSLTTAASQRPAINWDNIAQLHKLRNLGKGYGRPVVKRWP